LHLLLSGRPVAAKDAVGWLIDYAGPMNDALATAWSLATDGKHGIKRRAVSAGAVKVAIDVSGLAPAAAPATEAARAAITACVQQACAVSLAEAISVQAKRSAAFMVSEACRGGVVGADYAKTVKV